MLGSNRTTVPLAAYNETASILLLSEGELLLMGAPVLNCCDVTSKYAGHTQGFLDKSQEGALCEEVFRVRFDPRERR